ncbi:hypothetical protein LVD15_24810 [Fulvivirga maritima]|uniref:hypothetical protein n=1 Tax=Fulvivirga maritima TaxID=2904247 RepID=UPI001F27D8C6|nr:hypothetical protein [Fulvivirga maritima]UII26479.1 hypothetical protein LVD15_24810 [Fulvivirga maritima]
MDIQTKKIQFIQKFLALNNEAVIDKLETLLKKETLKESDQQASIEQYNREIDEAEDEMDRGEFISREDFKKQMDKW